MLIVATAIGSGLSVMIWTAGQDAGPGLIVGAAWPGRFRGSSCSPSSSPIASPGPPWRSPTPAAAWAREIFSLPRPLRRRDLLVDLADEVALMVEGLREQEAEERALLADAANRLRRAGAFAGGSGIATRLEVLASRKSQRLGLFA